ncbi:hypothetical protein BJ973_004527 [Actinoplanes tereljensis]|nr:hypothetical protein [Actinoplanes tereljensis]
MILALIGSLLVAGPARAVTSGVPAFTITKATGLSGGAIELTATASCTGGGQGEFRTALSQVTSTGQAYGTGYTDIPCDGATHTSYTLVLPGDPDLPGAALGLGTTATKTVFQPSEYPDAPWTALQILTPVEGDVTPQPDAPGTPVVTLVSAVTQPGGILVSVRVSVTCPTGDSARLSLILTELGFHNRVVYGTTTDQHVTCNDQPQLRDATMVLSATRSNSGAALISMTVDAWSGFTVRWAEDDLHT